MCAIPEHFRGVFTTRRCTNPHLPYLTFPLLFHYIFALTISSSELTEVSTSRIVSHSSSASRIIAGAQLQHDTRSEQDHCRSTTTTRHTQRAGSQLQHDTRSEQDHNYNTTHAASRITAGAQLQHDTSSEQDHCRSTTTTRHSIPSQLSHFSVFRTAAILPVRQGHIHYKTTSVQSPVKFNTSPLPYINFTSLISSSLTKCSRAHITQQNLLFTTKSTRIKSINLAAIH